MISAAIMAYNESANIPDLMKSLEGLDDIVIVDNGSTDDTVKLARDLGANVWEAGDTLSKKYSPTEDNISQFKEMLGWDPSFTTEMKFMHYGEIRNFATSLTKNEWVFTIDCDERVEWTLSALEKMLPQFDMITSPVHLSPGEIILSQRLNRKSKIKWAGLYHECVSPINPEEPLRHAIIKDGFKIVHQQRPREYRNRALNILEYMTAIEPTGRSFFFLGREYGSLKEHEKAIKALDIFIEKDDDFAAVNEALVLKGISYHTLGFLPQARKMWLEALERNPDFKDPLRLLARTSVYKEHAARWSSFADIATNENVLQERKNDCWVEDDDA